MTISGSNTGRSRSSPGCSEGVPGRVRRAVSRRAARWVLASGALMLSAAAAPPASGQACAWGAPVRSGQLDAALIDEASGLAVSSRFPGRLYHVNDSGDSGRFFVTDTRGAGTRVVDVAGFDPLDVEDLTLGPCGSVDGSCLFIADIGDNARVRDTLQVVRVPERERFENPAQPLDPIRIRYPDGARDAESIAVHPGGDLIIISKGARSLLPGAPPSTIYRLRRDDWIRPAGRVHVMERVGDLDLAAVGGALSGSLPTAFDISPDGRRFIVLTYVNAFEFHVDLSGGAMPATADLAPGVDFREIRLSPLRQQESIAYLGPGAFLYDTEAGAGEAPIMRVRCIAPR